FKQCFVKLKKILLC
ncbi:hypothetical protein DMN91_007198, partial [Ooceraea biroi]